MFTQKIIQVAYTFAKKKCVHYTVEERVNVVWEH